MKKLLVGLAIVGMFSGAGIVLACDLQQDASNDAMPMMSTGAPAVIACQGEKCDAKPSATASKKTTAKASTKAKAKPLIVACEAAGC